MDREVQPGVAVTLEEYFATAHEYEVEPDFVDGFLEDRCIGEYSHASAMGELLFALDRYADALDCHVLPSLSLRVSATRVRIVDVCLLPDANRKPIPDEPPLLCVEVLGSEDPVEAMANRCGDYFKMGVPCVWIVDPWKREGFVLTDDGGRHEKSGTLRLAGSPVQVDLATIFSVLDES